MCVYIYIYIEGFGIELRAAGAQGTARTPSAKGTQQFRPRLRGTGGSDNNDRLPAGESTLCGPRDSAPGAVISASWKLITADRGT